MSHTSIESVAQAVTLPVIPLRGLLSWALFAGVLRLLFFYFASAERGFPCLIQGRSVDDFPLDGRHLLGFPCH